MHQNWNKRGIVIAGLFLCLSANAEAGTGVPDAVRLAGNHFLSDIKGVAAHLEEAKTWVQAPLIDKQAVTRTWVIRKDGAPVRALVLSYRVKGALDEAERAKLEKRVNEGFRKRDREFYPPFNPRYFANYVFSAESCAECPTGAKRYRFRANLRDDHHGDGILDLTADHHVKRLTYTPAKLPAQATEANVMIERGPVSGGGWGRLGFKISFLGGFGPLKGSFRLSQTVSQHRRFESVEAALAAAPR